MNKWQPGKTAPKDGTTIFGAHDRFAHRGMISFWNGEWVMVDGLSNLPAGQGFEPTHWMPLPQQPIYREQRGNCENQSEN